MFSHVKRDKICHYLVMDQNLGVIFLSEIVINVNIPLRKKNNTWEIENKCKWYDFASSEAGSFKKHVLMHGGEKLIKCNQCDYASFYAGNLMKHSKTQGEEKSKKCNHCEYACADPSGLRSHLKTHRGKV